MKRVVYDFKRRRLRLLETPPPAARPGVILVRTVCSVISPGTERMQLSFGRQSWFGRARRRPDLVQEVLRRLRTEGPVSTWRKVQARLAMYFPLGYSLSGVVLEIGPGVDSLAVGDRVACAGQGYASHAEVVAVPRNLCVQLPENLTFEDGAFAGLGAIALHAVRQADVRVGEVVAVVGLGLIGQLICQIVAASACRVVAMDVNPARAKQAEAWAETATDREALLAAVTRLTASQGADAVIVSAASPNSEPIRVAGEVARLRGRVVVVGATGMQVPRDLYYRKELELRLSRSSGPGRYDRAYEERGLDYPYAFVRWTEQRNMAAFLDLAAHGRLSLPPLVTHRVPIEEAEESYSLLESGGGHLAIIFDYPQRPTAARVELPASPPLDGAVGIGVIGAGAFAQSVLLPLLTGVKGVHLRGVMTAGGLSAAQVAERFGFAYATSDPAVILADSDVHCVLIATRHDLHAALVRQALAAGKHVFVEKPLALSADELEAVIEMRRAAGREVMVGFNRRFAPTVRLVKGALTPPLRIIYRVNAGPVPAESWITDAVEGGGRLLGEAGHFLDVMTFLTGAPPVRVAAQGTDNDFAAVIAFADSSWGTLAYTSSGAETPKERLEVFTERAAALVDDYRGATLFLGGRVRRIRRLTQDKGHREEVEAFFRALRNGAPAPLPFEDAVAVTDATFALRESLLTGRSVELR